MTNSWAIEVRNRGGFTIFGHRALSAEEIADAVTSMLSTEGTGGIVIYRSTVAESNECETDEECLARKTLGITPHVCLLYPGHEGDHQWTVESKNLEIVASGNCRSCDCPPEAMPMINRGTGWCCEKHRKDQL